MPKYEISRKTWDLLQTYINEENFKIPSHIPKIQVELLASKLAFAYEKIRYAIDYKEEHLLRRHAIERTIKRNYLWKKDLTKLAKELIQELIRGGYLKNNYISETKIDEVALILKKYTILISNLETKQDPKKKELISWLLGLASVEIEYCLASHLPQLKLLENFYNSIKDKLVFQNLDIDERSKNIQIFIACHLSLLKSDPLTIHYHLLQLYVPSWHKQNQLELKTLASQLNSLKSLIDANFKNPLADQLSKTIKNEAVYFNILNDLISQNTSQIEKLLYSVSATETAIEKICNQKYKTAKRKLHRSTINSIIYIFTTKIILAFIIEVPYDYLLLGAISIPPLVANIAFHPLLMFGIATSTRVPSQKNTQAIVAAIKKIIYSQNTDKIIFQIKKTRRTGSIRQVITFILYSSLFFLTFGFIITWLSKFGFNLASGFLFVFFLTIISFFGIRIRNSARELFVLKRKENVITFIFDLLTLPLIRVGHFISIHSSKVNVLIFLFDYIIENPFKGIIRSIESGIFFIKQKKEEIL